MLGLSILALAAAVTAAHTVPIEHRGARIEATYQARTEIQTRTIGAYTPNRMDGRRCMWTAIVHVERSLPAAPALSRVVSDDLRLTGALPGACPRGAEPIERDVARREGKVSAHVAAVAEQDRTRLLAELEAAHGLAANEPAADGTPAAEP